MALRIAIAGPRARRGELVSMDLGDIDWEQGSILLKSKPKRTNRLVFFDEDAAVELARWVRLRERIEGSDGTPVLFLGETGNRLDRNGVYWAIRVWAECGGVSDPQSSYPPSDME